MLACVVILLFWRLIDLVMIVSSMHNLLVTVIDGGLLVKARCITKNLARQTAILITPSPNVQ